MKSKVLIAVIMCLALAFVGCAITQKVIDTARNVVSTVEKIVCDATADEVADAVAALEFFEEYPALQVKYDKAVSTFKNIRDKVCVSFPQIQAALAAVDQIAKGQEAAKSALKFTAPHKAVPKLEHLRRLVG